MCNYRIFIPACFQEKVWMLSYSFGFKFYIFTTFFSGSLHFFFLVSKQFCCICIILWPVEMMCWELEESTLNSAIHGTISSMCQEGGCRMFYMVLTVSRVKFILIFTANTTKALCFNLDTFFKNSLSFLDMFNLEHKEWFFLSHFRVHFFVGFNILLIVLTQCYGILGSLGLKILLWNLFPSFL